MATNHDQISYICNRIFLENFRTGKWKNKLISDKLLMRRTNKNWPSEDGNFYDQVNNKSLALEFKPLTEDKRGVQTGIGQCITYLNRFSKSYLFCPREVENFEIANYLKDTFKNKIFGKLPIGLIEHYVNTEGNVEINMLVDICETLETKTISEKIKESRYWAKYIDLNPHMFFLILSCAKKCKIQDKSRGRAIWRMFFDSYLLPTINRDLNPFKSDISHFGKMQMQPYRDTKKKLRKLYESGQFTKAEAIHEINQHCFWDGKPKLSKSKTGTDNLYRSYMKNYFKCIDHIELWDSNYSLNELGEKYLNIGHKYGPGSKQLLRFFGHVFLTHGNHYDLLLDLDNSVKGLSFDSITDARAYSQMFMEDKGLYKRNKARAVVKGRTKLFTNEFQLWGHLGFFKSNERFISGTGYNFDWEKINYYYSMKV